MHRSRCMAPSSLKLSFYIWPPYLIRYKGTIICEFDEPTGEVSLVQSARFELRNATAEAHAALELVIGSIVTKNAYIRYLRASFAFRAPLERAIVQSAERCWPNCLEGWMPTRIASDLRQDLRDLGVDEPSCPDADLAPLSKSPLGVCYVLEGANLGANLLRVEAERLGFTAIHGARHLAAQQSAAWKPFIARLEHCDADELENAKQSARAAFAFAHRATLELPE